MTILPFCRRHSWLILALLLLLSFFVFFKLTRVHYLGWDESVYLGMSRSIASWGDYGLWEDIRPPLLPLFLSVSFFFDDTLFIAEVVLFLFAVGTLIMAYVLALRLFSKSVAYISVLLLCLTPLFLFDSVQLLTGIPSTFFVLLSFYLFLKADDKKYLFFAGFFAALAFLARFPSGLFVVALFVILFYPLCKKPDFSLAVRLFFSALGFILPVFIFMLLNLYLYHSFTTNVFDAMLRPLILGSQHQGNPLHAVVGVFANLSFYPFQLFWNNPLFLFSLFPLVCFFNHARQEKRHILILLLPLLVFSLYLFSIPNKQLRFADVLLPFLSLLSAYGIFIVCTWIQHRSHHFSRSLCSVLLFLFVAFSFVQIFLGVQLALRFFPEQQLLIVDDYYSYLLHEGVRDATILTIDPRFAGYDHFNRYIPFYDNVAVAGKMYMEKKASIDYIVYDPYFFPCNTVACEMEKDALQERISTENTLVYREQNHNIYISVQAEKTV